MASVKNPDQSIDDGVRTAERVVKICVIISAITCAMLLIMVLISGRERLDTLGFVIPLLALQCFFYLSSKKRSKADESRG
jgi:hypothetical protein